MVTLADSGPVIDRLGPTIGMQVFQQVTEQFRTAGEARGRAEVILFQLALKFGVLPIEITATVVAAVDAMDIARLRHWTARVLTTDSIDEFLGPETCPVYLPNMFADRRRSVLEFEGNISGDFAG